MLQFVTRLIYSGINVYSITPPMLPNVPNVPHVPNPIGSGIHRVTQCYQQVSTCYY